ncbi:hypothetical protein HETIRDRAFT_450243 [Heterobasidion irregulare TC 32-1]|uniref:Uncharacterized protein n=1 Tax=Heterobasidion irregulare (strain TC 32-1) TaxID=747525 RepID=W4KGT6_HETIT|nr:uncharacterized protein HETIRDRAFT_450243 [Heterobasidion irregulare TC 32-1]ETW84924.1 hypothetical protein HETIRDRAFT_450243 [Heterobasidion irregulare TC 32-1]
MDGPGSGGDIGRGQRVAERGDLCARARPRRCYVTSVTAVTQPFAVTASDPHTWRRPARPRPRPPVRPRQMTRSPRPSSVTHVTHRVPRPPQRPLPGPGPRIAPASHPHRPLLLLLLLGPSLFPFAPTSSAQSVHGTRSQASMPSIRPHVPPIPCLFPSPRPQRCPPRSPLAPHPLRLIAPVRRVPAKPAEARRPADLSLSPSQTLSGRPMPIPPTRTATRPRRADACHPRDTSSPAPTAAPRRSQSAPHLPDPLLPSRATPPHALHTRPPSVLPFFARSRPPTQRATTIARNPEPAQPSHPKSDAHSPDRVPPAFRP